MSQENLNALEAALASLVPRTDRLDRDRLMFLAGQQSKVESQTQCRPTHRFWLWPTAFAAMTLIAATLAFLMLTRSVYSPSLQSHIAFVSINPTKDTSDSANIKNFPSSQLSSNDDPLDRFANSPPWLLFIQALFANSNHSKLTEAIVSSNSITQSYPQLRDQVLRRGLDSWQFAQNLQAAPSYHQTAPTTTHELLKEYLSTTDKPKS